MAFQWALAGFGPAGIAAAVAITIGMAALSGVFIDETVNERDYDDDGIYIPPVILPNPDEYDDPTVDPHPGETDDPDGDEPAYPTVDPTVNPGSNNSSLVFPWGFVCVSPNVEPADDYDPDIPDDIRPPSSDFAVAAEPYDSGAGWIIAALMGFIATFVITVSTVTSVGDPTSSDRGHRYDVRTHGYRNGRGRNTDGNDRRRYP